MTLKIAHIGDSHIGYRATHKRDGWKNIRESDVDKVWEAMIDDLLERDIDMLIHAGDVFHNHNVSMDSMTRVINGIRRLQGRGIEIVIISGNHDIGRVRTAGSVFDVLEAALADEDTHIVHGYEPTYLELKKADVLCIPWSAWDNANVVHPRLKLEERPQLLVAHGTAEGCADVIAEFTEIQLDKRVMDCYDYVALAHLHAESQVQENAWYSGSIDRFGWADKYALPGWKYVELGEAGLQVEEIELETRSFIAFDSIDASRSYEEVFAEASEKLDTFMGTDAMLRLYFHKTDPLNKSKLVSSLRKFIDEPWRLSFTFDGAENFVFPKIDVKENAPGLLELFDSFVKEREKKGMYGVTTSEMMRSRGRSYLERALEAREEGSGSD